MTGTRVLQRVIAILLWFGGVGIGLNGWAFPWWTLVMVMVAAGVTLRFPIAFFYGFPFALVLGDVYPYSGNLLWSLGDAILLGSAGSAAWNTSTERFAWSRGRSMATFLMVLGVILCLASVWKGWHSLPTGELRDQLSIYVSRWNAIRVSKGFVWGGLIGWLYQNRLIAVDRKNAAIAEGLRLTLLCVTLLVVLERSLFEGLIDFFEEYRATGPFSSMHIGGQHLDLFLALAVPLIFLGNCSPARWKRWYTTALTILAVYAAVATMSRATLVLILMQIVALAWISVAYSGGSELYYRRNLLFRGIAAILLVSVAIAVAWNGRGLRNRFEAISADWKTRQDHWKQSFLSARQDGKSFWLGRGMGTFPVSAMEREEKVMPPLSWSIRDEGSIRLSPGWPIYLQQWIKRDSEEPIELSIRARTIGGDAQLAIAVCRQAWLKSYGCRTLICEVSASADEAWQEVGGTLSPPTSSPHSRDRVLDLRPVVLSLYHAGGPGTIDVSQVIAHSQDKRPIPIENSSFRDGTRRWFFSCDDHLIWHAKNVLVHLQFEQGLLGALVFVLLIGCWGGDQWRRLGGPHGFETWLLLLSIGGCLGVALFDSLLDTPPLVALFFALLAILPLEKGRCR